MGERPYDFRRRLAVVHQPDRRDPDAQPDQDEVAVGAGWTIVLSRQATPLVLRVAQDLQDYLLVSMGESVLLQRRDDVAALARDGERVLVLATQADLPDTTATLTVPRSYHLEITATRVVVCGADERGVGQGSYFLEDLCNLRGAPFLRQQAVTRTPLFAPRMVHSGWGLDEYPDEHLNAMAHAGFDTILVFTTGVDRTPDEHTYTRGHHSAGRYQDFNALVDRAARYGLDTYFYAYFRDFRPPHPADPGAEAAYASTFGAIFAACPGAKGLILVGESVEFLSHDPRTTGRMRQDPSPDFLPQEKPSPGWWPCDDYPQWLDLVQRVVRRHNPTADIVFWTYNWGYAPEAERLALIRALPSDVTLQVTFEMFEPLVEDGVRNVNVDYTISSVGPGRYFASEAQAAHERGLRLHTMCNTGGLTWDFGVIPYEPVPYQWAARHAALRQAQRDWGLTGLMESHHFGWWPSFVSELAKWNYWTPGPTTEETLAALAQRDFGPGALAALAAWRAWSEAIRDYVPTNEDQYGPFRIGPAYPLVFRARPTMPPPDHALFGLLIVDLNYEPQVGWRAVQSVGAVRLPHEIAKLERLAVQWDQGIASLTQAIAQVPAWLRDEAARQLGIAQFIRQSIQTTLHVKQWWLLRQALFGEADRSRAEALLGQMATVAEAEIANAAATIPLVEADSRLGWEPSMDYLGDAAHIRWKIATVRRILNYEFPAYRAALAAGDKAVELSAW